LQRVLVVRIGGRTNSESYQEPSSSPSACYLEFVSAVAPISRRARTMGRFARCQEETNAGQN